MIEINQQLNSLKRLITKVKFRNAVEELNKGIRAEFYSIGKDLVKQSRDLMKETKTGRLYRVNVGRKGKTLNRLKDHRASAPGEAPAIITGALRDSVDFLVEGNNELHFGVNLEHITPDTGNLQWHHQVANYGKYLELGTSKMAARPFLKPVLKKQGINIFTRIENSVKKISYECMKP